MAHVFHPQLFITESQVVSYWVLKVWEGWGEQLKIGFKSCKLLIKKTLLLCQILYFICLNSSNSFYFLLSATLHYTSEFCSFSSKWSCISGYANKACLLQVKNLLFEYLYWSSKTKALLMQFLFWILKCCYHFSVLKWFVLLDFLFRKFNY